MNLTELSATLKTTLQSSSRLVDDDDAGYDWSRFIKLAVKHFSQFKPLTLVGSVTLVPGQTLYDLPEDFVDFKYAIWGRGALAKFKPWECGYPSKMPRTSVIHGIPSKLSFDFAPEPEAINTLGSTYNFYYYASHVVDSEGSTIPAQYEKDLLLVAQAEVMKEIGFDKVGKVTAKDPYSGMTRAAHPSVMYENLMKQFKANLCA